MLVAVAVSAGCSNPMSGHAVASPSPAAQGSPVPSSSPVARRVLPPARSFPAVALCSQELTVGQDGGAGPVLCADGSLNVKAWAFYAPVSPRILSAGPAASLTDVQTALRRDCKVGHARAAQEQRAYDLAAAYYGWSFDTDPTAPLDPSCA